MKLRHITFPLFCLAIAVIFAQTWRPQYEAAKCPEPEKPAVEMPEKITGYLSSYGGSLTGGGIAYIPVEANDDTRLFKCNADYDYLDKVGFARKITFDRKDCEEIQK